KILVATDGSKHGEKAAKIAIELAKLSGGTITAIYVADTSRTSHLPDDMLLFSIRELLIKEGNEALDFVESRAKEAGVNFERALVEGNPGEEIINYAWKNGMDIIIMGSVGRTGLDKFLLGSVAEKVVRNSKVPVLTIPGEKT
ncbi:MAG: universal stress protein, partial [Methanotrichaceae archaeon]|nr:universal stress protein [Methanotrichaceae archaeon]